MSTSFYNCLLHLQEREAHPHLHRPIKVWIVTQCLCKADWAHTVYRPTHAPPAQPIHRLINAPPNSCIAQPMHRPTHAPPNLCTVQPMHRPTHAPFNLCTAHPMHSPTHTLPNPCTAHPICTVQHIHRPTHVYAMPHPCTATLYITSVHTALTILEMAIALLPLMRLIFTGAHYMCTSIPDDAYDVPPGY